MQVKVLEVPMTVGNSRHLLQTAITQDTGVGEIVGEIVERHLYLIENDASYRAIWESQGNS